MASRGWENVKASDLRQRVPVPVVRSKYKNQRTVTSDGEKFDSKKEARIWLELQAREAAGEIQFLKRQVPYDLHAFDQSTPNLGVFVCQYIADFTYWDIKAGESVVADAKGMRTKEYRLKKAWMRAEYGVEILEM